MQDVQDHLWVEGLPVPVLESFEDSVDGDVATDYSVVGVDLDAQGVTILEDIDVGLIRRLICGN